MSPTMSSVSISPEPQRRDLTAMKTKLLTCLKLNLLTLLTFVAVAFGITLGFILRGYGPFSKRTLMYVEFPGDLFLRMLKGLILPLIASSLIAAVGSLDTKMSGKIGIRAMAYYMSTTLIAIILGIILVVSIRPGSGGSGPTLTMEKGIKVRVTTTADTLLDLVRNMFPPNMVEAAFAQYITVLTEPMSDFDVDNVTNTSKTDYYSWDIRGEYSGGTNIMGWVVFSVVVGIVLGKMDQEGQPLLDMCTSLSIAMMKITKWVIWYAQFFCVFACLWFNIGLGFRGAGQFGLNYAEVVVRERNLAVITRNYFRTRLSPGAVIFIIMPKIMEVERLDEMAGQVGMYTVTVMSGLFIHGCLILPLIYFAVVRRQPFTFISGSMQAIATAFATSSSSATLPVTIDCLEKKNGVDPRVTKFCLPIGAAINMDGTALYEAVAAIFISQVRGIHLDVGKIIAISVTATAASIGGAGIPQAGLVTMVMVLNVVGLPPDDVALILVVDWFLDRFRTAINILGDAIGAGVVEHLSRKDLDDMDRSEKKRFSVISIRRKSQAPPPEVTAM